MLFRSALSAFASVRTLVLRCCRFPCFAAARYTLVSLPSLTDLSVGNIIWPIPVRLGPLFPFPRSSRRSLFLRRVRTLEIFDENYRSSIWDRVMLQWFSTTSLAASLVDITVFSLVFKMDFNTDFFWKYVGPSTTRLTIRGVRVEDLRTDST